MNFILQRRLLFGDRTQWRSVVRFVPHDEASITEAVRILSKVDKVQWRIVTDDHAQGQVAVWRDEQWVPR